VQKIPYYQYLSGFLTATKEFSMAVRNIDKAEATSHKFVDRVEDGLGNETLWQECSDALGQVSNPAERQRMVRDLENNGVLPRMLLVCGAAIDLDGDGVTREEIDTAINDTTGDYKNQTKLSAEYAKEHFNDIDTDDDDHLTRDEIDAWRHAHQGDIHPSESSPYQQDPERPTDSVPENQKQYEKRLMDPGASAQEKLEAVEKLHELGVKSVTLTDNNGNTKTFQIQVEPVSPGSTRQYVHLYDTSSGRIVLRGIGADGNYVQEVGRGGRSVGYGGDIFSGNNSGSNVVNFDRLDLDPRASAV
jgi:hypothetical protein